MKYKNQKKQYFEINRLFYVICDFNYVCITKLIYENFKVEFENFIYYLKGLYVQFGPKRSFESSL